MAGVLSILRKMRNKKKNVILKFETLPFLIVPDVLPLFETRIQLIISLSMKTKVFLVSVTLMCPPVLYNTDQLEMQTANLPVVCKWFVVELLYPS